MRIAVGGIVFGLVLGLAAGCAAPRQQRPGVVAAPSQDELPRFSELERLISPNIAVEHRGNDPTFKLLPEMKEPELTAEEKAAVGEKELLTFLLYGAPTRPSNSMVAPWYGGASVAEHGQGGADVARGPRSSVLGVGGQGGVVVDKDTFGSSIARAGGRASRPGQVGPRGGVLIDSGTTSKVAARQRRVEH